MKIDTLKDLTELVKMCRKNGVRAITVDGITMQIDEQIDEPKALKTESTKDIPQYSEEDLLYWSSTSNEAL